MIDEVYDFSEFMYLEYHKMPVIKILGKRGTTHCLKEWFDFHLTIVIEMAAFKFKGLNIPTFNVT